MTEENAKVFTEEEKIEQAEQLINEEIKKKNVKKWVKRGLIAVGGIGVAALVIKVVKDQPEEVIDIIEEIAD